MINNNCKQNKFKAVDINQSKDKGSKIKPMPPNKLSNCNELPTIQCTCGAKILIVPDITAMNLAIKRHKAEHKEANERLLVEQIIKTLAKR